MKYSPSQAFQPNNTRFSLKVTSVTLPKLPVPRNTSVLKSSGVKRSSRALPMNLSATEEARTGARERNARGER